MGFEEAAYCNADGFGGVFLEEVLSWDLDLLLVGPLTTACNLDSALPQDGAGVAADEELGDRESFRNFAQSKTISWRSAGCASPSIGIWRPQSKAGMRLSRVG